MAVVDDRAALGDGSLGSRMLLVLRFRRRRTAFRIVIFVTPAARQAFFALRAEIAGPAVAAQFSIDESREEAAAVAGEVFCGRALLRMMVEERRFVARPCGGCAVLDVGAGVSAANLDESQPG